MQAQRVWRDRLEVPLRELLAITDRTDSANATAASVKFQQALEAVLAECVLMSAVSSDAAAPSFLSTTGPIRQSEWALALTRTTAHLGCPALAAGERAPCATSQTHEAATCLDTAFAWLSSRLHLTVAASSNDFFTLCAAPKSADELAAEDDATRQAGSGLLDDDNPLAAPTPTIPDGVHLAVLAIANAILGLEKAAGPRALVAAAATASASSAPGLREPVMALWFSFVLHFLQHMSSSGADAKGLWATFLADCREAVAWHSAAQRRALSKSVLAAPSPAILGAADVPTAAEREAMALWSTTLTPTLLAETVARTRFRRAAQLFRSNAPHLLGQAPHTAFLVFDVLVQFAERWTQTLTRQVPLGQLSAPAQALFSVSVRDLTSASAVADDEAAKTLAPTERALFDLVTSTAAQLSRVLGESGMHMSLVASLIGSVVCALYAMPAVTTRRAEATTTTAATSASSTPSAIPAVHVVGRRATTSRSALTNMDFESLMTSRSHAALVPAIDSSHLADAKLRRHGGLPLDGLEALEAHAWLLARPVGAGTSAEDYVCGDAEWRLRQFAPLGLVLKRAGLFAFLPPHLFHWSTQLRLGATRAQQRDSRQRLAIAALLTGLCHAPTALAMYHHAQLPPAEAGSTTGAVPSSAHAALAAFTRAMESFVCKAEMERVVEVSAHGTDGLGVLQETRKRRRKGREEDTGDGGAEDGEPHVAGPRLGELAGERFTRMVYPEPMPQWMHFLSQASSYAMAPSPSAPTPAATATMSTLPPAVDRAKAPGRSSTVLAPECVTPLRFLMELLTARYFALAVDLIGLWWCQPEEPVNVFLVPRAAFPAKEATAVNVQSFVVLTTQRWLQHWQQHGPSAEARAADDSATTLPSPATETAALAAYLTTQERVLREELLPLWRLASTFCARVDVLRPILLHGTRTVKLVFRYLEQASRGHDAQTPHSEGERDVFTRVACPSAAAAALARRVLSTIEQYVLQVIFPCLRVMPPSPVLYDVVQSLLEALAACDWRVRYGADLARPLHMDAWCAYLLEPMPNTPARMHDLALANTACHARRYPHDVLQSKERQALFVQSLKRMNAHTVDYYRRLLLPVWYADPLFVSERLLSQSVGYENNFLAIHTRLLHGVPTPILTLLCQRGLALMHQYVPKETLDAAAGNTRVGLIAAFLCAVWSDNTDRIDGAALLRAAELALRGETRFDTVFGLELLKAVLYQLLHRTLEHEEQFNDVQCLALSTATTTRLFGRGQMESFRVGRWGVWMTPLRLQAGYVALQAALAQPCEVPIDEDEDDSGEKADEESAQSRPPTKTLLRLSLGQHLLLHLARRQARIYALQADLDGTMETILAASARDYNTITDLLFALEELLPEGPPESLLRRVALPHVAMRLSAKFRLKHLHALRRQSQAAEKVPVAAHALSILEAGILVGPPTIAPVADSLRARDAAWVASAATSESGGSEDNTVLSYALLRDLSYFSGVHLSFDVAPYTAALSEMEACRRKIGDLRERVSIGSASDRLVGDMDDWLDAQQWQQEREKAAHKALYTESQPARAALQGRLEQEVFVSAEATYVLAVSHLLPRALLSLEETTFVVALVRWLLLDLYVPAQPASSPEASTVLYRGRVMDMIYAMITHASTLFVGLTHGECKRYGHLVRRLVELVQEVELRLGGGTPPAGLFHALPPPVAAVVAHEAARKDAVSVQEGAGAADKATSGPGDKAAAAVATSTSTHTAHAISEDALAAAFDFPRVLSAPPTTTDEKATAGPASSPLLLLEVLADGPDGVPAAGPHEAPAQAPPTATSSTSASPSLASLLQLEAFLLRFFTSVLGDDVNVPPHLHRHVFLILERLDKRAFPSTRLGTDLLLRAVRRHSHETNPNFASATAVLKGLRDAIRQRNTLLGLLQRYTEKSMLSTGAPAHHEASSIDVCVKGVPVRLTADAAASAMNDWGKQWRLRETYMGQLLARELQAAGMAGTTQGDEDADDEDEEEEDAAEHTEEIHAEEAGDDQDQRAARNGDEEDDDVAEDEAARHDGDTSEGSSDAEEDDEEGDDSEGSDDASSSSQGSSANDGEEEEGSGKDGDLGEANEDCDNNGDTRATQRRRLG